MNQTITSVLERREIPLSRPDITNLEREAVARVLDSPRLSLGPEVVKFEKMLASYLGARHAVAVNSGTSALHLCVRALGIGDGDEVITTPFSFVASANCILYERARPVFVDIDPSTMNLDAALVEGKISRRTKAILPVHVFGQPSDMIGLQALAEKYQLKIIEDACESIGATCRGKNVGTFGDCSVFAFYPNKQMTTAEGGAIITDNDSLASACRSMRNQGRSEGGTWLAHERLGYNYRLSDIHSALGVAQLSRIEELLDKRKRAAALYARALQQVEGISQPAVIPGTTRSWFVYVVLLDLEFTREQRNRILMGLQQHGVGCSDYFPPIHLQPFYARQFGYRCGDFPVCESISDRTIALPFFGDLEEDDVAYVASVLEIELRKVRG